MSTSLLCCLPLLNLVYGRNTAKAHLNFMLMTSTRLKLHLVIEFGWIETEGEVQSIYSSRSCCKLVMV